MFKLTRLWNLVLCDETYIPREIPPTERDFDAIFSEDIKLSALFDPSVKYQLIDAYGPVSFTEEPDGLLFEMGFTNADYVINWLLGFGGKVKVIEPPEIAEALRAAARDILERYEQT